MFCADTDTDKSDEFIVGETDRTEDQKLSFKEGLRNSEYILKKERLQGSRSHTFKDV